MKITEVSHIYISFSTAASQAGYLVQGPLRQLPVSCLNTLVIETGENSESERTVNCCLNSG